MNVKCFITNLITFGFVTATVTSLEEVNLKNLSLKTISSLINILSNFKNDLEYVKIEPNAIKPRANQKYRVGNGDDFDFMEIIDDDLITDKKFQRPGKQIIIKRLLPHGLSPSKWEFDYKYRTLYRPLVRVHKRKPVPKVGTVLNIDGNAHGIDKYGLDIYDYYDNDENILNFAVNNGINDLKHFEVKEVGENIDVDEELLQPFTTKFTDSYDPSEEFSDLLKLLEEIQRLLKRIRSRLTKADTYREVVEILDKISSLRSPQKSGEEDSMVPGRLVNLENGQDEGPPKPKKWIPHYPPWNFWTYKKTIYEDVCPAGQVKIANRCIWLPPH